MSVKNFKFVSPGVFINEIDNSFIPKSAEEIGPVVIGRSTRGLAMQPVTVESYSDFVEMFGETVPGNGGGDISRYGNLQSPMYGTFAAKAFLNANVAPLTYVRLLGQQSVDNDGTNAAKAGWKTTNNPNISPGSNGGAFGLWVWPSGSGKNLGTGSLAGVWYLNSGYMALSGTMIGGGTQTTASLGAIIAMGSDSLFSMDVSSSNNGVETIKFGFDDSADTFIRNRFNTNPQLASTAGTFYPNASAKNYWLGESFRQNVIFGAGATSGLVGTMLGIGSGAIGSVSTGPHNLLGQASREAVAGWFIGQDLGGNPATFKIETMQKLFRLKGRGHGEWLSRNCKVSIEEIRTSNTTVTDYGTFTVIIRNSSDTDSNVQVMERFDNCTLDPTSPDFVARKIGDRYLKWDSTARRLKEYGEYPNNSKFVYVEMNADVEAGASDPLLLPFGYYSPPSFSTVTDISGIVLNGNSKMTWLKGSGSGAPGARPLSSSVHPQSKAKPFWFNDQFFVTGAVGYTASVSFPTGALRLSSSDGGMSDPTDAYWGLSNLRTEAPVSTTSGDPSVPDMSRLLYASFPDDPTSTSVTGLDSFGHIFSLDDVVQSGSSTTGFYYLSGARASSISYTSGNYTNLLNAGFDRFTSPFWGGFDGFNILYPDPLYNKGMAADSTEKNSSMYYTWKQAMDTVSDPEYINMNLMAAPGLTLDNLTNHMINVCEERADSLALIDLADVYVPSHEEYNSDKSNRIGTTPTQAATALKNRQIDSSYGATFYPWVQSRDESTGRLLWIPPSVAMMGVLASSQAASELWFAPAGFNRGGLTDGAAGIPVTSVSERVISSDRDKLYEANINPIASFPSSGIVVFGQKTLQQRQSALDRINVRRLVIFLKKQVSILSTKVLFDQNVQTTWLRFIGLIDPLLANVKSRFGITDYRLILDDSTTTPDLIDQNILYAKIMIKPARAIEYIAIDFVIMSTGASFDD